MQGQKKVAVVGSGPNGLAAAIRVAGLGIDVSLYEASDSLGGSARSVADNKYPSISHDWGASSFPLTVTSPAFVDVDWRELGVEWLTSAISFSHAMPGDKGFIAHKDIDEMISYLGEDGNLWGRLFRKRKEEFAGLSRAFLNRKSLHRLDSKLLRFGPLALVPARTLAQRFPRGLSGPAATLFGTVANHAQFSLRSVGSSGVGLMLISAAHAVGWPIPKGGTGRVTEALIDLITTLGATVHRGHPITNLHELDCFDAVIWATHPSVVTRSQDIDFSPRISRGLNNWGVSGVSVTKIDFVVEGLVPWENPEHTMAPIVHLGGSFKNMVESKDRVRSGKRPAVPYMILSQPGSMDESRWSQGLQPVSVYAQHPPGKESEEIFLDPDLLVEHIERCAPGFSSRLRSTVMNFPNGLEAQNQNLQRGDIFGGASSFFDLLRGPIGYLNHYKIGKTHHFLGSSATWPGTGAHGMSGYNAADSVLEALDHES